MILKAILSAVVLTSNISYAVVANTGGVEFNSPSPLGVSMDSSCSGGSSKFGVVLRPTCNGTNLRGLSESVTVNPSGGLLTMDIALQSDPTNNVIQMKFPVEAMFPKNYGTTCKTVNKTTVISEKTCLRHAANFWSSKQNCIQWKEQVTETKTEMDCSESGNGQLTSCVAGPSEGPSGIFKSFSCENDSKKAIGCKLLYGWSGAGLAAVNSYYPNGYSSCHFPNEIASKSNLIEMKYKSTPGGVLVNQSISKLLSTNYVEAVTDIFGYSVLHDNNTGKLKNLRISFSQDGRRLHQVSTTTYNYSKDAPQCVDIIFSLVGGNRFCGSFYSPLMLFFDNNLPNFSGMSKFKLFNNKAGDTTYWPEKNSVGYFLAIDLNDNGKIEDFSELFGKEDDFDNGFEKLKFYDENKDNKIDENDSIFSKLLLWNDQNGNGQSEKKEIVRLSKKVKAIGLRYHSPRPDDSKQFGGRAEILQESSFKFKTKDDDEKIGKIYDIWFYGVR